MIIAKVREKCKSLLGRLQGFGKLPRDILIFCVIVLSALLSFGLGYLTGFDVGNSKQVVEVRRIETKPPTVAGEGIVASRSGTRYYFSWCSGASRISEANKVWFSSVAEAEKAGYSLAINCSAR
jgi:hypothetical protein